MVSVKSLFIGQINSNKTGKIEITKETILLIKTLDKNYQDIEEQIRKLHSYSNPAIFSILVTHVTTKYFDWLKGEID
jgi:uncharacterized protein involved in tolerance to divalent cations